MGKYMREAKITGDVAVMEIPHSTIGVLTRAKTLVLQRRQSSAPPPNSDSDYLQLRSRRLEKPPALLLANSKKSPKRNQKLGSKQSTLHELGSRNCEKLDSVSSSGFRASSWNSVSINHSTPEKGNFQAANRGHEANDGCDSSIEASFGENALDCEPIDRTPSSTTRLTNICTTTHRMRNYVLNIPSTGEIDEFFDCAEQQQRELFIEKYNFDVANDLPLPGRYEWVRANNQIVVIK